MHGDLGLLGYGFIAMAVITSPYFAAVLGVLLSLADGVTTWHSMRQGGVEANGFVARVMQKLGVKAALLLLKALGGVLMAILPFYALGWAWAVIAVYLAVVINNVVVYRKQRAFNLSQVRK
jgi:hypothetical protein